jgi:hypothetical protein
MEFQTLAVVFQLAGLQELANAIATASIFPSSIV